MKLSDIFAQYPIPIVSAENGNIIDSNPSHLSLKRVVAFFVYLVMIPFRKATRPATRSTKIANNAANVTFDKSIKSDAMGIIIESSAGDDTTLGAIDGTISYLDEGGELVTQLFQIEPKTRESRYPILFADLDGSFASPMICRNGMVVHTYDENDALQHANVELNVAFTGPDGIGLTVKLLTPKQPSVQELFKSPLMERLLRYVMDRV